MGRFTKIPQDTFETLQLDAGVLLNHFNPDFPMISNSDIICATTGGITATCQPTFSDLGSDVDNCPNDTKELKHLDSWLAKLGFTALGTSKKLIRMSLGAADIKADTGAIKPRRDLKQTDFTDIWWVGDKANGGYVAVRLINALSTAGLVLKTTKNGKGQITTEITGHVSINDQDTMPMEWYSEEPAPFEFVDLEPEAQTAVLFETNVSDMQSDVSVDGVKIKGTLKYLDTGDLVDAWGAGNFIALKFLNIDPKATSVKVGLEPSMSSGLVEIIDDPDKNGAFKITDKDTQKFVIETTDGTSTVKQIYDLNDLEVVTE